MFVYNLSMKNERSLIILPAMHTYRETGAREVTSESRHWDSIVRKYFANVFLFIQKSQLFKIYGEILALQDIYKVLLELYDADIGYYLSDLLSELDESIHQLNMEVVYFLSRMEDELYDKHKPKFFLDIQIRKVLFEKPIREYTGNIYRKYIEQFRELFDYEFREKSNTLLH